MDKIIHNNGLTEKELMLLEPFVKEPWRQFTLSDIKSLSKNKSHHYVFHALKKFTRLSVLSEKTMGRVNIYSVNCNNRYFNEFTYLESLRLKKSKDIPLKNIEQITSRIQGKYFSCIICGSYAAGTQTLNSDIDIAIIIPNTESKKPYEIALKEGELMIPEVHGFVFTEEEMYLMLTNDEFNYGKELTSKHIIIYGAESYYRILFEAIRHGFKRENISATSKNRTGVSHNTIRSLKKKRH